MARALDDFPELPLIPIDDGLTDDERALLWEEWDAELDAADVIEVGVAAAATLAEVRVERDR